MWFDIDFKALVNSWRYDAFMIAFGIGNILFYQFCYDGEWIRFANLFVGLLLIFQGTINLVLRLWYGKKERH